MKILLVYNPNAGHKRAAKLLPAIESEFNRLSVAFDLPLTDYRGHATELVRQADLTGYDGVIADGGDGTLFEVVNGYFANRSPKRIPIGVVPVGTGNAFARDLDLENSRWQEAVGIIGQNKPRKVDVGLFRTHGQTYYYLNILGLGFVADVGEIAHKLKMFGNFSYTLGVLYRTVFLKPTPLRITIDGATIERDSIFIEISNTRYTSNFLMAPGAKIDDGLLDVTLVGDMSRRRLLQSFPKIFTGEHILLKEVETFQVRKISIESDLSKILTPDGELLGITPVDVECLPQAIEVFWK
ncbi:MAG: diacylglycerol kinase family lipid kinase [Ignavibacteria bacterium]|nr:diacylglycerol kinase family lipid kinase [Ignavibacteria bacterium]